MLDAGAEGGPVRSCTGAGDVELEPDLARIVTLEGLDVIVDPLELAANSNEIA